MELGARNLAFLQLSTAGEECIQVEDGEKEGRSLEPGLREESDRRGVTTYFGLKNTLGEEQRGRGTNNERPGR